MELVDRLCQRHTRAACRPSRLRTTSRSSTVQVQLPPPRKSTPTLGTVESNDVRMQRSNTYKYLATSETWRMAVETRSNTQAHQVLTGQFSGEARASTNSPGKAPEIEKDPDTDAACERYDDDTTIRRYDDTTIRRYDPFLVKS